MTMTRKKKTRASVKATRGTSNKPPHVPYEDDVPYALRDPLRLLNAQRQTPPKMPCAFAIKHKWQQRIKSDQYLSDGSWLCGCTKDAIIMTPEDAYGLFAYHAYLHNRPFSRSWANALSEAIDGAVFNLVVAVTESGRISLVNGQHVMWAVLLAGKPVRATITFWACRDARAVSEVFKKYDCNMVRTLGQALGEMQATGALIASVSARTLTYWHARFRLGETQLTRVRRRESLELAVRRARGKPCINFATNMNSATNGVPRATARHLVPQAVGACFTLAWLANPRKAIDFVAAYITGVNLPPGDPRLQLRNKMHEPGFRTGDRSEENIRRYACWIYAAWRMFLNKQSYPLLAVGWDEVPRTAEGWA